MTEFSPEALAGLAKFMEELPRSTEALNKFSTHAADAASSLSGVNFNPLAAASKQAAKEAYASSKAAKMLGDSLTNAAKATVSTQQGTGKYAAAVDQAGDAVKMFGNALGPLGKAVTWLTSIFIGVAADSLKQNDALMKTYQTMSKFGTVDSQSFEKLLNEAHQAGYGIENINRFADVIGGVSNELAMMGQGAAQGKKVLLDVFDRTLKTDTMEALTRLGYTTDEMFTKTSSYLAGMAMSGGTQRRSAAELNAQTVNYMKNLSELSELTGKNRDDLEKERRAQEEDFAFQMYLRKLEREGKKEEAMNARMAVDTVFATFGKDAATGARQLFRTGGVVASEEGVKFQRNFGQASVNEMVSNARVIRGLDEDGRRKAFDANMANLQRMGASANRTMDMFGTTVQYGVNEVANTLGLSTDLMKGTVITADMTQKQIDEMRERMLKKEKDDRLGYAADQTKSEMQLRNAQENLTYQVGKLAVPAVTSFVGALNKACYGLARFTKFVTAGLVDFTDEFKSMNTLEDTTDSLNQAKKEELQLLKDKKDLDKEIAENEEKILEARKNGSNEKSASSIITGLLARQRELEAKKSSLSGQMSSNAAVQERAMSAQVSMNNQMATETGSGALDGLRMKKGDVTRDPGAVDPNLIKIAKQIQAGVPGFRYFSAFNDKFHMDRNSAHNSGKALDFTLDHWPTEDEGAKIAAQLQAMGATKVIDEYNHPSSPDVKGHFHAATARFGGEFRGPESGYPVQLHGHEAVVPMSKFNNFFKNNQPSGSDVKKDPLHATTFNSSMNSSQGIDLTRIFEDLRNTLSDKLDDLIYEQRQSKHVQEQLLTAAKH